MLTQAGCLAVVSSLLQAKLSIRASENTLVAPNCSKIWMASDPSQVDCKRKTVLEYPGCSQADVFCVLLDSEAEGGDDCRWYQCTAETASDVDLIQGSKDSFPKIHKN